MNSELDKTHTWLPAPTDVMKRLFSANPLNPWLDLQLFKERASIYHFSEATVSGIFPNIVLPSHLQSSFNSFIKIGNFATVIQSRPALVTAFFFSFSIPLSFRFIFKFSSKCSALHLPRFSFRHSETPLFGHQHRFTDTVYLRTVYFQTFNGFSR